MGRRYRLLNPVGRGGMGMVWHAHDVLLDRDVAVKELILPFGLDNAGTQIAFRRVLREARSAARLSHPGIVTVHDVVEEDGRPWIVMELVRAWSLEQAIRQNGPLPPVQAAEIGIRVLDALRHAHAHGILHRDVKPGNVLLTQDRVVLTDFGIAALEGEVSITQTGLLMGSPAYIPPERLQGRPITQAADLWSFGATLYAAVEGRPPYEGPDAVAVLGAVLTQEPARPERAGPLQPVIEGLLRKNPADRISAVQAAQMLEQVLAAHGSARPPQPQPETPDPTPLDALPPLDPPSGPMPSRIIETPSGPVKVPYDPSSDPANTYRPEALRKAEAASATEARMNSTGPHPISSSSGPHSISSSTGPHPVSPATGPHPVSSSTGPHPISTGPHRMPTQPAGPGGSRSSTGPHPVPNPVTPPHARTPRPADPAGLEDVPTGGRDRRATILLAAAAVAVVALMSAVVLVLMPSDPAELTEGGGGEETAEVAAPEATVVPSVVPSASPQQSEDDRAVDGEVPEGYRLRTANGVSVAVPEGWRLSATNQVATFTGERNSGLRIQIRKTTPAPADGGIAELSKAESEATFNEYLQVRLQRVSFKGWKASEWEYTYTELNQVPTHVVTRHVTIDADTAYLITFTAPDAEWEQHRRTLAVLWATFKPAR
ncbi:serine/threonine protein kinase [Thermopolyspora flexuosa]|uniref:non-specific serine/threonine protein kinase n=1 Tax=Thermopolyspora flexuosa TaxID=103836 RepID=A0A543IVW9_9ACTN|nr:serine/threonine protein kinase [Thermopolyspora flexuosa]GGM78347.1 serine/threonine protein kinase [Thermopolyspora flexuosa]